MRRIITGAVALLVLAVAVTFCALLGRVEVLSGRLARAEERLREKPRVVVQHREAPRAAVVEPVPVTPLPAPAPKLVVGQEVDFGTVRGMRPIESFKTSFLTVSSLDSIESLGADLDLTPWQKDYIAKLTESRESDIESVKARYDGLIAGMLDAVQREKYAARKSRGVTVDFTTDIGVVGDVSIKDVVSTLEVEWMGTWYPASVIESANGATRIHYTGYGPEWDEWVAPARIRPIAESR